MPPSKQVEIDPITQNNMITWRLIAADKAALDALELQYRNAIIPAVPFDPAKIEGSQTVNIGEGLRLELDRPMYYTIKGTTDEIMACMNAIHAIDPMATIGLLRWKPEIVTAQYRTLTEEQKQLLSPVLTIAPGQAALKLIQPKKTGDE